jgi:hypothetical protein
VVIWYIFPFWNVLTNKNLATLIETIPMMPKIVSECENGLQENEASERRAWDGEAG